MSDTREGLRVWNSSDEGWTESPSDLVALDGEHRWYVQYRESGEWIRIDPITMSQLPGVIAKLATRT